MNSCVGIYTHRDKTANAKETQQRATAIDKTGFPIGWSRRSRGAGLRISRSAPQSQPLSPARPPPLSRAQILPRARAYKKSPTSRAKGKTRTIV